MIGHAEEVRCLFELYFFAAHMRYRLAAGEAVAVFRTIRLLTQAKCVGRSTRVRMGSTEEDILLRQDRNLIICCEGSTD